MSAADPTHARRAPFTADPQRLRAARVALAEAHRSAGVPAQMHTHGAIVRGVTAGAQEGANDARAESPAASAVTPRAARCVPTGWPAIDRALGGGLARGSLIELTGALSSGRLSAAVALLTSALRVARDPVAFIDVGDALDPRSFDEGDRARVLWVRAVEAPVALRALDVVLDGGGFSLAVLYLAGALPPSSRRRKSERDRAGAHALAEGAAPEELVTKHPHPHPSQQQGRAQSPGALWMRLAQRASRAGTVVLVVTDACDVDASGASDASDASDASRESARPHVVPGPGPFAHARIATQPRPARWYDGAQATFLDGRALGLRVERARLPVVFAGPRACTPAPDDDAWLRAV